MILKDARKVGGFGIPCLLITLPVVPQEQRNALMTSER